MHRRIGLPSSRVWAAVVVLAIAAIAFPLVALASHSFTDVPNGHPFHADIAALKDSGVSTTGCGGGKFCPDDFVTRGQMAAFLNRLGALSASKTPVANATKLDGYDSTAFNRPLYAVVNADGSLARGYGVVSTLKLGGTGQYEVIFNRDVTLCAYMAIAGVPASGTTTPVIGSVAARATNDNGVFVMWETNAGADVDTSFHLSAVCADSGVLAPAGRKPASQGAPQP